MASSNLRARSSGLSSRRCLLVSWIASPPVLLHRFDVGEPCWVVLCLQRGIPMQALELKLSMSQRHAYPASILSVMGAKTLQSDMSGHAVARMCPHELDLQMGPVTPAFACDAARGGTSPSPPVLRDAFPEL